jgi:glycosyltransferase involved in cell wall biosynthesis
MKILIATGIFPPHAGGPSYYSKNLRDELLALGHKVSVRTFTIERWLPTGIRHAVFFIKTLPAYLWADTAIVMDTFSVAVPVALMKKWFGGKMIIRTGGDFLWEQYVERTAKLVIFSEFYAGHRYFTKKEQTIFRLTKWVLSRADHVVFNSEYQRRIWKEPYDLDLNKTSIIENAFHGVSINSLSPTRKNFICVARPIRLKNIENLKKAFDIAKQKHPEIELDLYFNISHKEAMEKLAGSYCAILVSLSDISPNFAIEALSLGKPVIITRETGLEKRIGHAMIYVDPLSVSEIAEAIVRMVNDTIYTTYINRIKELSFNRSYTNVAKEFSTLALDLKSQ